MHGWKKNRYCIRYAVFCILALFFVWMYCMCIYISICICIVSGGQSCVSLPWCIIRLHLCPSWWETSGDQWFSCDKNKIMFFLSFLSYKILQINIRFFVYCNILLLTLNIFQIHPCLLNLSLHQVLGWKSFIPSCVSKCQFVEKPIGSFGPHLELGLCIVCSVGCISCSVVSWCQLVEKHSGFLSVAPTSTHPAALFRSTWFTKTAAHITLASFYSTQHPNSWNTPLLLLLVTEKDTGY